METLSRRQFVHSTFAMCAAGIWVLSTRGETAAAPRQDPTASLQAAWTARLPWDNVVDITTLPGNGEYWDDGTPEMHPWGFRKGSVVRDNYVYCSGRCAIGFRGDGVLCAGNVIRFAKDVLRPTVTGVHCSYGSSTNDNRAIEMRGWRWIVERNDYEVFRNYCSDGKYYINDGEGLMHEDHCNSEILDSRLVNNRGNSYLSLYHVEAINGLHIEGNDISTPGGNPDIYVTAPRHKTPGDFPIRRVTIVKNTTRSNGIRVMGWPAEKIIIRSNRHLGSRPGIIHNEANALLADNSNYEVKSATPKRGG